MLHPIEFIEFSSPKNFLYHVRRRLKWKRENLELVQCVYVCMSIARNVFRRTLVSCRWKRQLILGRKFTFADDEEKQQNASESVENFNPII